MVKEEGIPKKIIEEIKLKEPKEEIYESKLIVEKHQVKIRIPSGLLEELEIREGDKCLMKLAGKNKFNCEIKR